MILSHKVARKGGNNRSPEVDVGVALPYLISVVYLRYAPLGGTYTVFGNCPSKF